MHADTKSNSNPPCWPIVVFRKETIKPKFHIPYYQAFISLSSRDAIFKKLQWNHQMRWCPNAALKIKPNINILNNRIHRYNGLTNVTMIPIVFPISQLRRRLPLPRSRWRVTKIFVIFCTSIYCSFVKFCHWFGYHIEIPTNNRAFPSFKHMNPYAND